jgi:hypothetical protein
MAQALYRLGKPNWEVIWFAMLARVLSIKGNPRIVRVAPGVTAYIDCLL